MEAEKNIVKIQECVSIEALSECVRLQREVFGLPEIEISPVRHFIVTKHAGGFTLGAYVEEKLIGFVLSVPAFLNGEKAFYSHMTAVKQGFQSLGVGSRLKWVQREKSLEFGVKFIKWTFQPVQARNAFFNLEKLGAVIKHYEPNFYGTDYSTSDDQSEKIGLDSDRLFAEWHLESEKVVKLHAQENFSENEEPKALIEVPNNWSELLKTNPRGAVNEQNRLKKEFQDAFAKGLIAKGFRRDEEHPQYLLY